MAGLKSCRGARCTSCVYLLLLLVAIAQVRNVHMQQTSCRFRYITEPGPTSQRCNIIGTRVIIACHIAGELGTAQWHYSSNVSHAGSSTQDTHLTVTAPYGTTSRVSSSMQGSNDRTQRNFLFISMLDQSTVGYYWCSVKGQPTPSQVLYISYCDTSAISSCNTHVVLSQEEGDTGHCADQVDQNVSIVHAQELNCDGTTMSISTQPHLTTQTTTDGTTLATTAEEKPTIFHTSRPLATEETSSTKESSTTTEFNESTSTLINMEPNIDVGLPQGSTRPAAENIWLAIGIVLALVLLSIFVLLVIIVILQCRKRGIKDESLHSPRAGPGIVLSEVPRPGNTEGDMHLKQLEPKYIEAPKSLQHGFTNPVLSMSPEAKSLGIENSAPISPVSRQYEDISLQPPPPDVSSIAGDDYETIELDKEPPEYSKLQHSGCFSQQPSTSSMPCSSPPPKETKIVEGIFDDPAYEMVFPPLITNEHTKVQMSLSAPNEEYSRLKVDNDDYLQELNCFTNKNRLLDRKLSCDSSASGHTYMAIDLKPNQGKNSNYTFKIVDTNEKYVSEHGHVYHLLEPTAKSQRDGSNSPNFIPTVQSSELDNEITHSDKLNTSPNSIPIVRSSGSDNEITDKLKCNELQGPTVLEIALEP